MVVVLLWAILNFLESSSSTDEALQVSWTFSYTQFENYALSILKYSFTNVFTKKSNQLCHAFGNQISHYKIKRLIVSQNVFFHFWNTNLLNFLTYSFISKWKLIKNKICQLSTMCRKIFHYVSKRKLHVMKSWASWTFLEIDVKKLKTISKKSVAQIFKSNCSCHFDLCTKYF